jgi:glycosyltransferase involved in cell wall biosynthesis
MKSKKITIASVGGFPINRLALNLYSNDTLECFITNYPKILFDARLEKKIKSQYVNGLRAWIAYSYFPKRKLPKLFDLIIKLIHINYGAFVSRKFCGDGLLLVQSSFAMEVLQARNEVNNARVIIDHGSLHLKDDRLYALESAIGTSEKKLVNLPSQWVIDREDIEFDLADWVVVPSNIAKKSLIKNGVLEKKILTNHLGVDTNCFFPAHKQSNVFRVLQVGQISERKGVFLAINAFLNLGLQDSRITFVGSRQHSLTQMENCLKEGGERIKLVDSVSESELINYYGDADVLIMPSYADGFGMVVLQAMACGLPVIISDKVGASEIINHGVDGFVFESGNLSELTGYLSILHQSPKIRKKMGMEALKKARNEFTWEQYCERYIKILMAINL